MRINSYNLANHMTPAQPNVVYYTRGSHVFAHKLVVYFSGPVMSRRFIVITVIGLLLSLSVGRYSFSVCLHKKQMASSVM